MMRAQVCVTVLFVLWTGWCGWKATELGPQWWRSPYCAAGVAMMFVLGLMWGMH